MQILYVSESVRVEIVKGEAHLIIKGEWKQEGVDRALAKCDLTLEEVEVIYD